MAKQISKGLKNKAQYTTVLHFDSWHHFLQQFVPVSASPGHSSFTVVAKLISSCFIILSAEVWYTPEGPVHFIQKASSDSFLWNSGIAGKDKMNNKTKPCWKRWFWEKMVKSGGNLTLSHWWTVTVRWVSLSHYLHRAWPCAHHRFVTCFFCFPL